MMDKYPNLWIQQNIFKQIHKRIKHNGLWQFVLEIKILQLLSLGNKWYFKIFSYCLRLLLQNNVRFLKHLLQEVNIGQIVLIEITITILGYTYLRLDVTNMFTNIVYVHMCLHTGLRKLFWGKTKIFSTFIVY